MRRLLSLILAAALAAPAAAQVGVGIDFGLDAGEATEKSEREERSRPLPYAIALEMEFSSAAWHALALSSAPDWRWLLDREDCPWYPTMRLFRQQTPGVWQEVFRRIAAELATLATQARAKRSTG